MYRNRIVGRKNYSKKCVTGADLVRTTNVRDHAEFDQHAHVMNLYRIELTHLKGLGATSYTPIAQALSTLLEDDKKKLSLKFDIAYFVATEQLVLTKYSGLCELETRHVVDLGSAYLNNNACKDFTHYIAESNIGMTCFPPSPMPRSSHC